MLNREEKNRDALNLKKGTMLQLMIAGGFFDIVYLTAVRGLVIRGAKSTSIQSNPQNKLIPE